MASLDKLIHDPIRLAIMSILNLASRADFQFLMNTIGTTKGNLSSHLTKLEQAGYLKRSKEYVEKDKVVRNMVMIYITEYGKESIVNYWKKIDPIIKERVSGY